MTDLSQTIAAKSDQLNADDLIGAPRTITVTRVSRMQEPDQPIAIGFEGDGGKPYKPCKSMRRVLVMVWGADGAAYVGRRMTLYRDDKVRFGNAEVGGIRISHMSDISQPVTMALTVTRANRRPYTVAPLRDDPAPARGPAKLLAKAREKAHLGPGVYAEWAEKLTTEQRSALATIEDELRQRMADAEAQADRAPADEETV